MTEGRIEIYADGACKGNPGPGGWGVLLCTQDDRRELFGGEALTTNNRMELTAVIRALEDPGTKRSFAELGLVPVGSTPQEFSKTIVDDIEFHRRLVKQIGLAPQ